MTDLLKRAHGIHAAFFDMFKRLFSRDLLPLLARLTLAGVFWRSLLTKVETVNLFTYTEYINDFPVERARARIPEFPLEIKASTLRMFETEFALPLIPAPMAAWLATLAEFALPILLVLGLFTRLSAVALLGMTLVIQVFVYPQAWWGLHALWAVMTIYLAAYGPGRLSVDHFARGFFAR